MRKLYSVAFSFLLAMLALGAEPLWQENFDTPAGRWPAAMQAEVPGRGGVLHVSVSPNAYNPTKTVLLPFPLDRFRGQKVFFGAEVKTANISHKPNSWNGVKVMLIIETPSTKSYPQPDIPEGSHDWQRFSIWVAIPQDATNLVMVLGLENVTGEAWFDNASIVPRSTFHSTLKVDSSKPLFLGHPQPRLRGAMAGTALSEEDIRHFAQDWKGNLLRLQIFEAAQKDRELNTYDAWLNQRLEEIDQRLAWCRKYGVMAVLDLHSPPGGQAFSAGYVTARGRIFTDREAQARFVQVWQKMAARYKGNRTIWGFDLVNEPDDSMLAENCLDWNSLADRAARAVRAVDPERTLIVEPDGWGGPQAFDSFEPLDLPGVVYSYHFYQPMHFTHQGIQNNPAGVTYPGVIDGKHWDKQALEEAMRPALEFAHKYRVQMYVGEFSAIRTAPAASAAQYLADVIDILESHGFDWSYHAYREWQGWSLEHEGPLNQPAKAETPTPRQNVVVGWFQKNDRR